MQINYFTAVKSEKINIDKNIFKVFFYTYGTKFPANAKPGLCDGDNSSYS